MAEVRIKDTIAAHQEELALLLERYSDGDGIHSTAIPSLHFLRASHMVEPLFTLHKPALCIIAQGSKIVLLAQESYQYDPSQYLVVSVDLPISGQVIEASPQVPYLCFRLEFDQKQIFDIISSDDPELIRKGDSQRGLFVSNLYPSLSEAVLRLVRLLDTPEDIPMLAPLIIREILYRILKDEQGDSLKQIAIFGSQAQRIAKVISLIKEDFAEPLRIEQLALSVNMSSSSLHHHFKKVTAMSPLQYQKQLRLQEARRLMLADKADAANASFQVGYESPSQFNREYSRMFGLPPISDIKRLRKV